MYIYVFIAYFIHNFVKNNIILLILGIINNIYTWNLFFFITKIDIEFCVNYQKIIILYSCEYSFILKIFVV